METLLKLDAWENQWFPIAQAALDRRFPAVSAWCVVSEAELATAALPLPD